ncbi:hypothetical protein GCM10009827_062440 [Dactylosporangium maewongense]|uniref:Anaphase-promoting complex subunit 4-like WD40 domain-containing protein n=1 Tax=Dactylosporangium maewongense TaxID=634393 RepID=A0ABN2B9C8_9ACTN
MLATAAGHPKIRLLDVDTGRVVTELNGDQQQIRQMAYSPDGQLLAAADGSTTVRLWKARTGHLHHLLSKFGAATGSVAFTPDSSLLATAGAGDIGLWDPATGKQVNRLRHNTVFSYCAVAFSGDGTYLAGSTTNGRVVLWETDTWQVVRDVTVAGAYAPVWDVAFEPGGTVFVTGDDEGTMSAWDAATGRQTGSILALPPDRFRRRGSAVCVVRFSASGRYLTAATGLHDVRLWAVTTPRPAAPPPRDRGSP